jgi:hypothetical protein
VWGGGRLRKLEAKDEAGARRRSEEIVPG